MSVEFCPTCGWKRLAWRECSRCGPSARPPRRGRPAVQYVGLLLLACLGGGAVAACLSGPRPPTEESPHQGLRAVARPFAQADAHLRQEQQLLREQAARLRFYNQRANASDCIERAHARAADRRALARWCVVAVGGAAGAQARTAQGREGIARAINEEYPPAGESDGDALTGFLVEQILDDTRARQGTGEWRRSVGTALASLPPSVTAEIRHAMALHGVEGHCAAGP
jgi:hypothetical protein